jgi:hypothetical protein
MGPAKLRSPMREGWNGHLSMNLHEPQNSEVKKICENLRQSADKIR